MFFQEGWTIDFMLPAWPVELGRMDAFAEVVNRSSVQHRVVVEGELWISLTQHLNNHAGGIMDKPQMGDQATWCLEFRAKLFRLWR